jgi:hypothetical protein
MQYFENRPPGVVYPVVCSFFLFDTLLMHCFGFGQHPASTVAHGIFLGGIITSDTLTGGHSLLSHTYHSTGMNVYTIDLLVLNVVVTFLCCEETKCSRRVFTIRRTLTIDQVECWVSISHLSTPQSPTRKQCGFHFDA